MKIIRMTPLALLLCLALAVAALAADMTKQDLVNEAKEQIVLVSVDEAKAMWEQGNCTFIDCREADEYQKGHVPGAMNLPRGLIEFKIAKLIPDKTTPIVIYCRSGGRGCLSTAALCRMGYCETVNMAGGWLAWSKAQYPVE